MAGFPAILNLVDIVIKQILKSAADTYQDPDYREASLTVNYGAQVTLKGQANFGTRIFDSMLRTLTGSEQRTRGHLVFRTADLATAGVTLQTGDLVLSIAGVPVNLLVRELRHESPLNGGFLLVYAMLENNPETRSSN